MGDFEESIQAIKRSGDMRRAARRAFRVNFNRAVSRLVEELRVGDSVTIDSPASPDPDVFEIIEVTWAVSLEDPPTIESAFYSPMTAKVLAQSFGESGYLSLMDPRKASTINGSKAVPVGGQLFDTSAELGDEPSDAPESAIVGLLAERYLVEIAEEQLDQIAAGLAGLAETEADRMARIARRLGSPR